MQSVTNWGSSEVTGRGLMALVGRGQVYSVELKAGEQYIAHPRYDWTITDLRSSKLTQSAMLSHTRYHPRPLNHTVSSQPHYASRFQA